MKKRIIYLDFIRGIAIVMIVLGHSLRGIHEFGLQIYGFEHIDLLLYSIHLPIIFFLSGYSESMFGKLNCGEISYKEYLKKNFVSLYIPYIIFSYVFWCIKFFVFSGNTEATILDLFLMPFIGKWHLWYLLSLLLIKAIFGLFESKKNKITYSIVLFLLIYASNMIFNFTILEWLSFGIFYTIGFMIHEYKLEANNKILLICFISIVLCFLTNILFLKDLNINRVFLGLPLTFILNYYFSKLNSIIKYAYIGKNSLVVYLVHTLFTSSIRVALDYFGINSIFIHVLAGVMLSIILSLAIILVYKKVKIFNWIEYLFYPKLFDKIINKNCKGN